MTHTPTVTSRVCFVDFQPHDVPAITISTSTTAYGALLTATASDTLLAAAFGSTATDAQTFMRTCRDTYINAAVTTDNTDRWQQQIFSATAPLTVGAPATAFRRTVHMALTTIPPGTVVSYQQVAAMIGQPQATRAVASAIAANTVAVAIPCHRVWRSDHTVGQFRWGSDIKRRLCADEQSG